MVMVFHYFYHENHHVLYKVVRYTQAERADTLPQFLIYPYYVLCGESWHRRKGATIHKP
jgi:hypothetical protein